jgi:predicted 3-demethylubiquinone-9 3-methyltransferase (glyoxalase superfamily)
MANDKVFTCLWYKFDAEEAVNFYTSLLEDSRVTKVVRYGKHGPLPEGTVLTVSFQLAGRDFMALNGGPHTEFNDSHSMVVQCETQKEIDRLWAALLQGGKEQQCGWLIDKYGLRWQIVPAILSELMEGGDSARAERVMSALLKMVKLDIAKLEAAAEGK